MYVLGIAIVLSLLTGGLLTAWLGFVASILPALVVFVATYLVLARVIGKRLESVMLQAQSAFQKQHIDQGLLILQQAKKRYGNWQLFVKSSIDGQIGSIYYARQDFTRAKPYLERAFGRYWLAKAMLGVLHYRRKEYARMDKTFEQAVRFNGKESLLWSTWAYCHWKLGQNEKALSILQRAKKKIGEKDLRLNANLLSLQNAKKMKMKAYGELWDQFHLEVPAQVRQMRSGNVKFMSR